MSSVLKILEKYQKQLVSDLMLDRIWRYYNSNVSGTFAAALKNNNRRANCATIANWVLRELKVFKSGMYFWGRLGGTLACSEQTMKALTTYCKVIHVNGKKTVQKALKDGTLQPGDIVTYVDIQHTNIYAGDGRWYDAGHAYCKESGEGAKFISWYGKTLYYDQKIAYIIRYKEPKQTIYRVQVGAYTDKANADLKAEEVTKKSGFPCFEEKTDMIRVYCGSFTEKANAKKRMQKLTSAGILGVFIKKVQQ